MPSIRWDRRALIVIIFGIVTAVLWILCIWQLVLRYKTETSSSSSLLCENKGEYKNGRCFCTEEWVGPHCETVNFCENSIYPFNSSQKFTFTRIIVDRYGYSEEKCEKFTVNAGTPKASRKCSKIGGKPTLDDVKVVDCSKNLKILMDQLHGPDNISSIASNTQILTSVPEKLTTENISTAADIAEQILKNYSQEATATVAAVATVSQLLDARVSEFNFADDNLTIVTASLTQTLQNFSLDGSAIQPNIAVNHISLKPTTTTAFFSAQTVSGSLQSENINVDENVSDLKPDNNTEVQILINVTKNNTVSSSGDGSIGFVLYQNDKFFQSKNYKTHFNHAKQIISGHVANATVNDVKMIFNPKGLQICILYTFRSPIFKKKVTELFSYVSLPDIPISLHSKTYYLLKFRYKKHTYENFKPSETFSEEMSFSSSDQTPTKN
ncbi:adhesion G-protein coupled receptor G7 [Terrapene carolina triunguis]|uniref:adhesion G-protein coupled receptor G7 n=1 Tax=Terrapene triunguis TaxID=2587831 RepID=UPI00115611F1|nr:adhesion G-protein coupled receptor G7 [Terrapene carolina triunguis]